MEWLIIFTLQMHGVGDWVRAKRSGSSLLMLAPEGAGVQDRSIYLSCWLITTTIIMGCKSKSPPRRDYRKTLDPLPESARDYPYPPKPPKPHFPGLEVVEQPVFRNYKYRYGAYPGYQDAAAEPIWQDGSTQELARKLVTPTKNNKAGRVGQTDFGVHERVMGDLTFARNPNVSLSLHTL